MKRRYNTRRSLFAILLLMVMTLQMGVKSFHVHHHAHAVEFACSDCEHHRVHSGHILAWDGHSDDCPLCQMLVSPYVPAEELRAPLPFVQTHTHGTASVPHVVAATWCTTSPRGPPASYYKSAA